MNVFLLQAQENRKAIRETWGAHPGIAVKFFLAQPVNQSQLDTAVSLLTDEARRFGDIVVVPGGH